MVKPVGSLPLTSVGPVFDTYPVRLMGFRKKTKHSIPLTAKPLVLRSRLCTFTSDTQFIPVFIITESWNGLAWKGLRDHLLHPPLPWARHL